MDSAKILHYWHLAGAVVAAVSVAAAELTPVVSQYPKASAIVASLNGLSLAITSIMTKIAQDKVIQAVVNAPAVPTPTGIGIPSVTPTPDVK